MPNAPTSGLCNAGTPSTVSGSGPWSWTCNGSGSGSTVSCTAYKTAPPTLDLWADSASLAYNTATTLRWNSTNATSCTASGNYWSGGKAVNGAEGTGNLTSTGIYTLTCSGAGGSISRSVTVNVALPPLETPSGLQAQCNAAGDWVTLSWSGVSGATMYPLRINDESNGWTGGCPAGANPGDTCDNIYATSYTRTVVPGRNYGWWVHAYRAADGVIGDANSGSFRCNAPVTVSGRVFNQSTGAGYAGVSIPACAANPGATTDDSGNFSFSVPYDAGYCIRLNPEARDGTIGPVPTGYPASLQWAHTYEYQRAGVNCTTAGCGGDWNIYDRATDTGFDFVYTNMTPRLIICPMNVDLTVGGLPANLEARYWADLASVPDCNTLGYTTVTPLSTWTSDSPDIATVTNSGTKGIATGVSAGTAFVTADYSGLDAIRRIGVTCVWDNGVTRNNPGSAQCTYNDPTCTVATCGKTLTGTSTCAQTYTDNCGAQRTGNCQTNTCVPKTVICPTCPPSYKEVAP